MTRRKGLRALLVSVLVGLAAALALVTPAHAAAGDGVIKNNTSSDGNMTICKDWGVSSCSSSSPRGTLAPGQNSKSKYGWADTDGYWIPSGWSDNYGRRGPLWVKVAGCFGCTKGYTLIN
jgi:hypothetical protein